MQEDPLALRKARREKKNKGFDRGYPDEETIWAEQDSYNIMRNVITRVDLYARTLEDIAGRELEIIGEKTKAYSTKLEQSTSWKVERFLQQSHDIGEVDRSMMIHEDTEEERRLHLLPAPLSQEFIEDFLFISDTPYIEEEEHDLDTIYFTMHSREKAPTSEVLPILWNHTEYLDAPTRAFANPRIPLLLTWGKPIAFSIRYQYIGEKKVLSGLYLLKRWEAAKKFLDHWAQSDIGNPLLHRQIFLYIHGLFPDTL